MRQVAGNGRGPTAPLMRRLSTRGFSVTSVTIFQRQSGGLQAYKGVLKRTALTERKGIG